ncbi:2'-5' RNA ligase family protein [Sphingobium phenoxybenzoativorans]|uniref:2'-5' RNA ligase family protein n=1 Tax=Sphingobium phenoxybenzoativorans TaxID=1592790 RepID=UPI0009F660BF|nr:2'-5' RNA ligase family protein [Sphingobium phenoxybenzoativorans]
MIGNAAPIILTATMGAADFAWADTLRRAHFPAGRNKVPAHITLFHHLPPGLQRELMDRMAVICRGKAPAAQLAGLLNLGNGVAFRVESAGLDAIRAELADMFQGLLTPQDQAKPRFHITVQNKVSSDRARLAFNELNASFRPRPLVISGLAAWRYMGGPWEPIRAMPFRG